MQQAPTPAEWRETLYFQAIKEGRGDYFIEYKPPNPSFRFATLALTFPQPAQLSEVVRAMETEAKRWIQRYPVPVMVSSFDGSGELQELLPERSCNHLIAFRDPLTGQIRVHWELLKDEDLPDDALSPDCLKNVYADVRFKTQEQLTAEVRKSARAQRVAWLAIIAWIAVVPGVWAIVEWAGPFWLGTLVMLYSVWNALKKTLKLLGRWSKSARALEEEERKRKMRHYYYHCEKNPEGFIRLRAENFDREQREEIAQEAAALRVRDQG